MFVTKRINIQKYLVFSWIISIFIGLFFLFSNHGFDDPFITYRYAENIALGRGFVYNPGERVLSTTTPLYALVLALAYRMGLPVPLTSIAIGALSLAVGGWVFWRLGQLWKTPLAGAIALILYPLFPLLLPTLGAETSLYVTLILLGILSYAQERYMSMATMFALATLTRADGVVAAGVVALHWLATRRRPLPWSAVGLYLALLLPWFCFAWFYFGTPLPVTLSAKQGQGRMAISQSFAEGLITQLRILWHNPLYRIHLVLATIGLYQAITQHRSWLLLIGWNILYAVAYSSLGVTSYFWYYGPLQAGLIALTVLGVTILQDVTRKRMWRPVISFILTVVLLVPQLQSIRYIYNHPDQRINIYQNIGIWLKQSTPQDAAIGTLEVGIIGYYADRRMVDFAGLLQPETAQQFTSETTYDDIAYWATLHFLPQYLVLHDGLFPKLKDDKKVQSSCHTIQTFHDARYPHQIDILRCQW